MMIGNRRKRVWIGSVILLGLVGGLWLVMGSDEHYVKKAFAAEEQLAASNFEKVLHAGYKGEGGHRIQSLREYREELNRMREKLKLNPRDPRLLARRVHLAVTFEPARAISECREILVDHPRNTFALNHLAAAYFQQGDVGKALEYAARSLNEERHPNTCHLIARLFLHQGRWDKAREYFEAALDVDPGHDVSRRALQRLMLQGH